MKKYHQVTDIYINNGILSLSIDGNKIEKNLMDISPSLAEASNIEQSEYDISPSGYGIYWPLIDEDLSIDGLLGIRH
ncbi:MAG: DUF2442 domain-containing protein [Gammaproteobacteria bacterium]|nr:DUF2442 domain-containing protein [Gammaproteobacteria bacterium]